LQFHHDHVQQTLGDSKAIKKLEGKRENAGEQVLKSGCQDEEGNGAASLS
jgi:hypothetical protein